VQVTHVVPGVGTKAGDRKRVAELFDRPGEQRDRFLTQFEHRLLATADPDLVVERLGEVEQQQHGEVATVRAVAHVDPRRSGWRRS
jgi:16S rRNA G527 N7-methylase RsmG